MSVRSYLPSLPPLLFALVFVSVVSSKSLHLLQHVQSLPLLYFILYSPTLILSDLLVIVVSRLLLVSPETRLRWILFVPGAFVAISSWFAAAVQYGFFFETGAEVEWSATDSFVRDPAAMKILMSGISSVTASGTVILLVSFVLSGRLYSITGRWLDSLWDSLWNRCWQGVRDPRTLLPFAKTPTGRRCAFQCLLPLMAVCFSLIFLEATRPSVPYDHLARALPLTLLDAFHRPSMEGCRPPPHPFPFPHGKGGPPHHHPHHLPFDWAFGKGPPPPPPPPPPPLGDFGIQPSWLPDVPPPGFNRWQSGSRAREDEHGDQPLECPGGPFQYYNPRSDPLKISNIDDDIAEPLKQAFKDNSVEINHVVLLTLESGRKEVFPMQSGTLMHDYLVESHEEKDRKKAIDKLSQMTPIAQMLTGEYALNSEGQVNNFSDHKWQDKSGPGMGGINVKGGLTASTLTLKSILGSHCGVSPLPVDLLEEINLEFYQPCIPQILELFNRAKNTSQSTKDGTTFLEDRWRSIYVQSSTDSYDRQHQLNDAIGFERSISRETLRDPMADHWPPVTNEINYFGYAETETMPYLRDLVFDAAENGTRLFLSHLTSSTHHPWRTPKSFHDEQYTGDEGGDHDSMNDYLNTVRYVDDWLGDILGLLDEAGIANSTLVVIIGDHGQAFSEDAKVTGTFENGHISNFRVPIVFRHPHLPHIDVTANATSLAIIPTILDLLVQSQSLDEKDSAIASSLLPEYQGQSLLRPFRNERPDDGLPVWNFALINGGGAILAITTTNSPFRLIMPLKEEFNYRFTHLEKDPGETKPLTGWSVPRLADMVRKEHGHQAADWLMEAERVGRWWVAEQKRIWDYRGE